MVRFCVLVALCGCDLVWGVKSVEVERAACGPYTSVREVMFNGITDPRSFSISSDGTLALVFATDALGPRPIPLRREGDAWTRDPAYDVGLDNRGIAGANLAPSEETPSGTRYTGPIQPAMNVWIPAPPRHQVNRYYWSGTSWTVDTNQFPLLDPEFDTRAGNVDVVQPAAGALDRVRYTMLVKISINAGVFDQILIAVNSPPSYSLVPLPDRTRPLNEARLRYQQAVLTDAQDKLVYAAMKDGQYDLFASPQSPSRDFSPGGLIDEIATADDEIEPWIDATCSQLYFRRVPAGRPNAPGQIFLAE